MRQDNTKNTMLLVPALAKTMHTNIERMRKAGDSDEEVERYIKNSLTNFRGECFTECGEMAAGVAKGYSDKALSTDVDESREGWAMLATLFEDFVSKIQLRKTLGKV